MTEPFDQTWTLYRGQELIADLVVNGGITRLEPSGLATSGRRWSPTWRTRTMGSANHALPAEVFHAARVVAA
jgi:hypothetical protein